MNLKWPLIWKKDIGPTIGNFEMAIHLELKLEGFMATWRSGVVITRRKLDL